LLILIDADGTPDQVSKAIEQALQQRFNGA